MPERDLAGTQVAGPAPSQARVRDGMMRRPERPGPQHPAPGEQPGHGVQLGGLERGRDDPQAIDLRRFERIDGGHDHALEPGASRRDRDGQDARRGHELSFERELTGEGEPVQERGRDLRRRGEHARGDGKVEARPFFAEVAGREVDHNSAQRPLEFLALDGGADAFDGVSHRGSREPRQGQRRQPPSDVRLDRDDVPAHAQHRHAQDPSVHGSRR